MHGISDSCSKCVQVILILVETAGADLQYERINARNNLFNGCFERAWKLEKQ